METKQKIALLRGQGNQTDLGGVLADILDELSESGGGGVKKLTITGYLPGCVGENELEEGDFAERLGIEVSELRALCDGYYDVLVQEEDGRRTEWRQAMLIDHANTLEVYFTVVEAMTSHYVIYKNYNTTEDKYTYYVSFN